jgi:RES domain-containing protein
MTTLPAALDPRAPLIAWRLDMKVHASAWDSGVGAEKVGGRWNSRGTRVVYGSLDPATCLLEAAVHKGFDALQRVPHVFTRFRVLEPAAVGIVQAVPNPAWLRPGLIGAGQQRFGDTELSRSPFVLFPSVVSRWSWNLVFRPDLAKGGYSEVLQQDLRLDGRLNSPHA